MLASTQGVALGCHIVPFQGAEGGEAWPEKPSAIQGVALGDHMAPFQGGEGWCFHHTGSYPGWLRGGKQAMPRSPPALSHG